MEKQHFFASAFCLNELKNICFDPLFFSRDQGMLSELRYDSLGIYKELVPKNLCDNTGMCLALLFGKRFCYCSF